MSDLVLFWHRNDLRISDSIGLAQACHTDARVIGVFCFDRSILSRDDIAPARVIYMLGCLKALAEDYRQAGSQLLFLDADPAVGISQLASTLKAKAVYWHHDVEPYSQTRDDRVTTALRAKGIQIHTNWDRLLHDPTTIRTGNKQPYSVYSPFWRNWNSQPKPAPVEVKLPKSELTPAEKQALTQLPTIDLPTASELGFTWEEPLIFEPGTKAAEKQLATFCHDSIFEYDEQRNYPAISGTSGMSAALKFGTIGIRTVWAATTAAMTETHFKAWCEGKTGYPIVDAAMRQLNQTGWMHNRCRMIVASFLTKDLIINWQWGEKYFMQTLIDGDLAANNGGWQWSASSGMDPKPLRIFNPYTQAQKFDRAADYICQWVPELKSVDTKMILSGDLLPLTRHQVGYPLPIVDHSVQQRLFKDLYASVKGAV
jgi:deoxyribodipyrimidine photo-lyase